MTDIKPYLKYCEGKQATLQKNKRARYANWVIPETDRITTLTYWHLWVSENTDMTIIPHLRKMESLTEMEAEKYVSISFGANDIDTTEPITYKWNHMHWTSYRETKEKTSIAEFTARQILYLTEIGIAWWATEEMWEKGFIFEVK
jgi:hypothetical protein